MSLTGPRVLVISGATASGKTALGVRLARRFDAEIVSADSIQIYHRLAIGSARPDLEEQGGVAHHLLDFLPLEAPYDAARFRDDADRVIASLNARKKRVIVVGGAGLYLRALIAGLAEGIPADPAVRAALHARIASGGPSALAEMHRELSLVDPTYAARIAPSDPIRIVRALEVYQLSGEALSAHHARHQAMPRRYNARWICLETERSTLKARIAARAQAMLDRGWLDEVREILRDGHPPTLKPLQSVGYAEVIAHLQGRLALRDLHEAITLATAGFAKRQRTWFRGEPDVAWQPLARFDDPRFVDALFDAV